FSLMVRPLSTLILFPTRRSSDLFAQAGSLRMHGRVLALAGSIFSQRLDQVFVMLATQFRHVEVLIAIMIVRYAVATDAAVELDPPRRWIALVRGIRLRHGRS